MVIPIIMVHRLNRQTVSYANPVEHMVTIGW